MSEPDKKNSPTQQTQTITVTGNNFAEFNPEFMEWDIFQAKLEQYFLSVGESDEQRKTAFLLTKLHQEVFRLLRDISYPKEVNVLQYQEIMKHLKNFYGKRVAVFLERKKFYALRQQQEETINEWYTRVKKAAINCKFENFLDTALRDIFITGMLEGSILDKMLEEDDSITLDKAWEAALKKETIINMRSNNVYSINTKIQANREGNGNNKQRTQGNKKFTIRSEHTSMRSGKNEKARYNGTCHRCGKYGHAGNECIYRNYVCDVCKMRGHLKAACRRGNNVSAQGKNQIKAIDVKNEIGGNVKDEYIELKNITVSNKITPLFVNVKIDGMPYKIELDTGSSVSVLPLSAYEKFFNTKEIIASPLKFKSYSGEEIKIFGKILCDVEYAKKKKTKLEMYITEPNKCALLGRDFVHNFNLKLVYGKTNEHNKIKSIQANSNKIINEVSDSKNKLNRLTEKYQKIFVNTPGKFKFEKISLKMKGESFNPIFLKPRTIPYAIKNKVENELDRLTKEGIITPVEYNEWGTPLVPVLKNDGQIRLCGDYKCTLNKFIEPDHFPIPRIQDILQKLSRGEKFSKIDLKEAYSQIELDDESKKLCAWSTTKGVYLMNRMPYGISPATSKFQRIITKLFQDLNNVVVFVDDILVTGENDEEHLQTLERVFQRLEKAGLTVKLSKCEFFKSEIHYLGQIISKEGIRKNPEGVKAILKAEEPKNVKQIQAFAGLVNYYGRYIPNISIIMEPIYNLLRDGTQFQWSNECQTAFEKIKEEITSDRVLIHYHPEWEVILECDASDYGIAAALSHKTPSGEERPIAFASRVLSTAERNYSVLDKEALAVYFGVKKFSDYLYGRKFTIRSDHKPLLAKYGEHRSIPAMAAKRVHRWATFLAAFNYKFEYVKGNQNKIADMLSRFAYKEETDEVEEDEEECIKQIIQDTDIIDFQEVQKNTEEDETLNKVKRCIVNGWPTKISEQLKPFFIRKEELSINKGVILWGLRVIIPEKLQEKILHELHSTHLGISKMKSLARSYVWWPKMDEKIENVARSCLICANYNSNPPKAQVVQWPAVENAWERIHADFAGPFLNKQFLIIVDSYTKWIEVFSMNNITAEATIEKFYETFARYGIPQTLCTDNGPTFTSCKFQQFLKRNGVNHVTSPPGHPQSNGLAENAVKTFKLGLKKIMEDEDKADSSIQIALAKFLFYNRNVQHTSTGKTPASLMFNRNLRMKFDLLKPSKEKENPSRQFSSGEKTPTVVTTNKIKGTFRKDFLMGDAVLAISELEGGGRWPQYTNKWGDRRILFE